MRTLAVLLALAVSLPAAADDDGARIAAAMKGVDFSGVVLVRRAGKPLFHQGFGEAKKGTPMPKDGLFDIGSVTKPVVATTVLRLVASGKLKLATTVGSLFPDAPADKKAITVKQLLAHNGGLPRMYERLGKTRPEHVASILALKKGPAPQYSNLNYFLLGAIVEKVSGATLEATTRKEVYARAKLTRAGFCQEKSLDLTKDVHRHEAGKDRGSMAVYAYGWGFKGATGAVFDAAELARFCEATLTGDVLPAELRTAMQTKVAGHFGLGWYLLDARNGTPRSITHGGASAGARALLTYFPDSKTTVVILSNKLAHARDLPEYRAFHAVKRALFTR